MNCPTCESTVQSTSACPNCRQDSQDAQCLAGGDKLHKAPNIRAQVFESIVQQALHGRPWKQIGQVPMLVNNITEQEVEEELSRRQGDNGGTAGGGSPVPIAPQPPIGGRHLALHLPQPYKRLLAVRQTLKKMIDMGIGDEGTLRSAIAQLDQAAL